MSNKIRKRMILKIQIRFTSPLSVASGEDRWTDSDVMRNAEGVPFVPGSSLAGAMRAYLENEKDSPCMLGYSGNDGIGKMSSIYFSDLEFDSETVSAVRDGVALTENKTSKTGSKYDLEILEANQEGHFFLEIVIREQDDEKTIQEGVKAFQQAVNDSEIRLGTKKTRGFGVFEIIAVYQKSYDRNNYLEYAQAYSAKTWEDALDERDEWLSDSDREAKMVHVEVPLKLKGGISIRQYAGRKGEPDYTHLTDHGKPVIPGTSFAGAIRHRMNRILEELCAGGATLPAKTSDIIDYAFGYVDGKKACASSVIINESVIQNAKPLTITRTGVSRFEAAVKKGALYKERTYVDGELVLKIAVRKEKLDCDSRWILGLLLLAIKDLQNGFLAVGGLTAIGRGTFCENGAIRIDGETGKEESYIADIFTNMKTGGGFER